jgi:hypothetical protein
MSSSVKPRTFAISYGFLGGPGPSRHLRRQLRKAGYTQTGLAKAEIVIGHSAGCRFEQPLSAKLILLVGMNITDSHPPDVFRIAQRANFRSAKDSRNYIQYMNIGFYSFLYGLIQPRRNRKIVKRSQEEIVIPKSKATIIFIANKNDPWPIRSDMSKYIVDKPWGFLNLPGSHNDIWEHPKRYVEIINYYARLLA